MLGVHSDTVAFSPTALIKCLICLYPHLLTCTPREQREKTIRDRQSMLIIMVAQRWSTLFAGLLLVSCCEVDESSTGASLVGKARGHLVFVEGHRKRSSRPPQLPQYICQRRSTRNIGFASGVELAVVCSICELLCESILEGCR